MARPTSPARTESGRPEHLINAEADKALSRIVMAYFFTFAGLLLLMTFVMAYLNIPGTPLFPDRRFLDMISILVVMAPFFFGTNKFFATRLKFGREFVEKKEWREAVASLEAFNHVGQRFLDPTGEAHYLLAVALDHQGKAAEAERAREFVLRARPTSTWAEEVRKAQQNRQRAPRPIRSEASGKPEENRSRPAKVKRRRL